MKLWVCKYSSIDLWLKESEGWDERVDVDVEGISTDSSSFCLSDSKDMAVRCAPMGRGMSFYLFVD